MLPVILLFSLVLNLWGNRWGAPNIWNPDEVTERAMEMVANRTLNPHYFAYGGLHYYTVAVGAIIPAKIYGRLFDPKPVENDTLACAQQYEREQARTIQIARVIAAIMSMLVVAFTFFIGASLFDKQVGYLAALFLTVSMSFVGIAHFAKVDAPGNFWYWLSCVFGLLIWKQGNRRWYVLAALTAGLAIGVKTDRVLILFPLLLSHFLRREGLQIRKLLWSVLLVITGFVVANPTLVFSFFEFCDGYTRELFFNASRDEPRQISSYILMLEYMKSGLGWPLFIAALAGLAHGLFLLARRRNSAAILWLLATFLPYYLIFGSKYIVDIYLPLLFPPLLILAAKAGMDLQRALPPRFGLAVKAGIGAIVVYSFFYTLALILQFSNDSRLQASKWIEQHVPANATIEMLKRGPVVSKEKYHVHFVRTDQGHYDFAKHWRDNLAHNHAYQKVRQAIINLEHWLGRFGFPVRKQPYLAWYDMAIALSERPAGFISNGDEVRKRQPDYVVLVNYLQEKTLAALQAPDSGYRLVAQFHFVNRFGWQPSLEMVNPEVSVFQREGVVLYFAGKKD